VTEGSNSMSMFEYDARPVTPQVVLVGQRASSVGYSIRDFLSRNGVPTSGSTSTMRSGSERWFLRTRWIPADCRCASSPTVSGLLRPQWTERSYM
jgi:hypothetical protein